MVKLILLCAFSVLVCATAQRITTIHLDGVQYFISRMNPYSPELNYFLAYQYCRSLGLQLASFETKEKAESMTTYLKNAGYGNYDFWTSGNRLGTGMFLWMSTGLPFNATFDFFENSDDAIQAGLLDPVDHNSNTSPQRTARDSSSGAEKGCVILKQPTLKWMPEDCSDVKDFICEQTRCYYYNYGSIPVSSAQGRPITSTTPRPPKAPLNTFHSLTTPQPNLMSTNGLFNMKMLSNASDSLPSYNTLKLSQERALDSEYDELEEEAEEHGEDDDVDENKHLSEHARVLSDRNKEHVFPLSDNELQHDEIQSMQNLQMQLQLNASDNSKDTYPSKVQFGDQHKNKNDDTYDDATVDIESDVADAVASLLSNSETSLDIDHTIPVGKQQVSTTDMPGIEVRLKKIAKDFEKMTSNENHEITPQSSLSLSDLIRTLRPNDMQIIPQIDSDYSNAMRVLGKTSAVVNKDDSRKFKVLPTH